MKRDVLKLIGHDGTRHFVWELKVGSHAIGRKEDCTFCIPNPMISRVHAEINVAAGGQPIMLTDKGSSNGTVVNGSRVIDQVQLQVGDRILLGKVEFRVVDDTEEAMPPDQLTATHLSEVDLEKSASLSLDDALRHKTSVADLPGLFQALSEMAGLVAGRSSQEEFLDKSLAVITGAIPCERLIVLLGTDTPGNVEIAASSVAQSENPDELKLSSSIVHDILNKKRSILISDPVTDLRYAGQPSIMASGLSSAMAAPLFDEGEVYGILYADTKDPQHVFNEDLLRAMATFGNIMASALKSFVYAESKNEMDNIKSELHSASLFKQRFLVREIPTIPGYQVHARCEKGNNVSGDFFDIAKLPDGRFIFLIGELSCNAMGATLLMSSILATFRVLAGGFDVNPVSVVEHINKHLCRSSHVDVFATIFVGALDANNHSLDYVNAGHHPPFIVHENGSANHLEVQGVMIGALDEEKWSDESVSMNPGDVLTLFTSGLVEARGSQDEYGEGRLLHVVSERSKESPLQISAALQTGLNRFQNNSADRDDFTLFLLKRDS